MSLYAVDREAFRNQATFQFVKKSLNYLKIIFKRNKSYKEISLI